MVRIPLEPHVGAGDSPPSDRFFRFYADPPLEVVLADEDRGIGYGETLFRRVQDVIEWGGYHTCDLG